MKFVFQCVLTTFMLFFPVYLLHSKKISSLTFKFTITPVVIIAFVLPIVFRFSLSLQRGVLYLNFLDIAKPEDLKHLERFNVTKGRNFYINNGNITLGAWHILPFSLAQVAKFSDVDFENSLEEGHTIFIYLHGNIGTRATEHRLQLYRILSDLDYHVITFDYRSYGDSTYSVPHERALVSDGVAVCEWVFTRAKNSPIFIWGHSLGTGLTTNMMSIISKRGLLPKGVILEAPFDNMPSEIRVHPFGTIFRILPWYDFLFSRPYYTNDEDFNSSKYILEYFAPTLILHAEDDNIIPSFLGEKLFRIGQKYRNRKFGPMDIEIFRAELKYGHTFICRAPDLPDIIRSFVNKYKDKDFHC